MMVHSCLSQRSCLPFLIGFLVVLMPGESSSSIGDSALSSLASDLQNLARDLLPEMHAGKPEFIVRELSSLQGMVIASKPAQWPQSPLGTADVRLQPDRCVLLDVYTASHSNDGQASDSQRSKTGRIDTASLRQEPFNACWFRVLWARGRGGSLDWLPDEQHLCTLYDTLLVEDEFLLHHWRGNPLQCLVHPLSPHQIGPSQLIKIPWEPGGKLPEIDRPLVSFHAYTAYENEAQSNPQKWLENPDDWHPILMELKQQGFLKICLNKQECLTDDAPYRLMFWWDISSEFVDCISRGIMPIYFNSPPVYEYITRNIMLVPYQFTSAEEMGSLVQIMSSQRGVLEYGTKVFMQRLSNHILANLYFRQDVRLRALITASTAYQQRFAASSGMTQETPYIAELIVCVTSAPANTNLRNIIRQTWGQDSSIHTRVGPFRLRVLFFVGDSQEASDEQERLGDVVVLRGLQENFANIWVKTAAIMKFGADYLQGRIAGIEFRGRPPLRYLLKCDDDAFVDVDSIASDLLSVSPVGLYWGHVMALVEPNRIQGDKYFVPWEVYDMPYYPPYARGMAYILSEDLAAPVGTALQEGSIDPFPYREDVSVGLYLMELAKRGKIRVTPQQRKDFMPIDFPEHCGSGRAGPLLVLHRFRPEDASCLWSQVEARRASQVTPVQAPHPVDFCTCVRGKQQDV